jgi:exportin-2 (importin alpha re-exporter)
VSQDEGALAPADKVALRPQLVLAMISLFTASHKPIRTQVAELVSLIARNDFPDRWPDLDVHPLPFTPFTP